MTGYAFNFPSCKKTGTTHVKNISNFKLSTVLPVTIKWKDWNTALYAITTTVSQNALDHMRVEGLETGYGGEGGEEEGGWRERGKDEDGT